MLKFLGCIMIVIASTGIGFTYGNKFKKRNEELNEFQRSLIQIQNEIIYTHTPLPEAILNTATKSIDPISEILEEIANLLEMNNVNTVYEAFGKVFKGKNEKLSINNEDIKIIVDLSKTLGESDIEGQKKMFLITLDRIKNQIKNSEMSVKSNVKLCRYLGFCLGCMLVIMIL